MITNIERPEFYSDIKFCKVWMKSMHAFKSYWAEKNKKTKSKKGHNSAKIWRMIKNIKLDLYFIMI